MTRPKTDSRTDAPTVTAGQVWQCDESNAGPDAVPDAHDVPLWEDQPRFHAVVDRVEGGVAELTVTRGNSHPRVPDTGSNVDLAVGKIQSQARWSLESEASSTAAGEEGTETAAATDGGRDE